MAQIELKQVIGKHRTSRGQIRCVPRQIDKLMRNGRQIATINRVPGSPIVLLKDVYLSAAAMTEVSNAVAAARGGIPPVSIIQPFGAQNWEIV